MNEVEKQAARDGIVKALASRTCEHIHCRACGSFYTPSRCGVHKPRVCGICVVCIAKHIEGRHAGEYA